MMIKICGVTNKIDAIGTSELGVDMIGFVFYRKAKRFVEPRVAEEIINELPPWIGRVGVFVDEKRDKVQEVAEGAGLNILQFHGDESPEYCERFKGNFRVIKAFRLKDKKDLKKMNDYNVDFFLLDTYLPERIGGTGEVFNWKMIRDYEFLKPIILSGGLTPKNVPRAIKEVSPYGVDVSTGVEKAPGKKDIGLVKDFVEAVRRAS